MCRSTRADQEVLDDFLEKLNTISKTPFIGVSFTAYDRQSLNIIYHTDCMLTLLDDHAIVCLDAIKDPSERAMVRANLENPELNNGRPYKVIEIDHSEMEGMCANLQNLRNEKGQNVIVMSLRARNSLREDKWKELEESSYEICVVDIGIIEEIGGGSARCMMVEKF